jgi:hypothetical protein
VDIDITSDEGLNPLVAIATAIAFAVGLVLITFIIFLNSGAYKTVKQIQAGTSIARALQSADIDTRSPIKSDDISVYESSVTQRLNVLDDSSDFGPNDVTDANLGLSSQR